MFSNWIISRCFTPIFSAYIFLELSGWLLRTWTWIVDASWNDYWSNPKLARPYGTVKRKTVMSSFQNWPWLYVVYAKHIVFSDRSLFRYLFTSQRFASRQRQGAFSSFFSDCHSFQVPSLLFKWRECTALAIHQVESTGAETEGSVEWSVSQYELPYFVRHWDKGALYGPR